MLATARSTPAQLMRPKAPKAGKRILLERIPFLWRHLGFSAKVSARNLFRYKKRFWMTVIGVAGCTALLIAGLGLRSSIFSIIDIQYGEIYRYSAQTALDTEVEGAAQQVEDLLQHQENVTAYAQVYSRSVTFSGPGGSVDGYLTVPEDAEALYQQIDFRDMDTGEHLDIPQEGVLIDEKLAELLDLQVGDTLTLDCGTLIQVPVGGIVEHYIYHYAYMDRDYYTALQGEEPAFNTFYLTAQDDSEEAVSTICESLMALDGVNSATNLGASARSFRETMEVVNAAVTIIVLSAAALALVVLYNLTNINITERLRELATIKVLGFYDGEVAMYIYRENIVLTLLGIALGQVFGKFLCTYLVRTIEMDIVMFGRDALLQNYVWSVVLSLCFAVLVNFLMYFRMKKIDMVQSLKSVE
jgi:putative ABC transport system permease protein